MALRQVVRGDVVGCQGNGTGLRYILHGAIVGRYPGGDYGTNGHKDDENSAREGGGAAAELPPGVSHGTADNTWPGSLPKTRNGVDRPDPAHEKGGASGEAGGAHKTPAQAARDVAASDYELPPEPGRGFWYWLFGTNNVSQANRENNIQVGRMRQNIREAKERRRQVIGAE